jgi:GT2 family glycosyltransferase
VQGLDEIIVVDNGSGDGTQEYLRSLAKTTKAKRSFRYLLNSVNLGTSYARNQGVAHARGELLLFFDNDAYCKETSWLQHLAATLATAPEIAVTGPLIVYPPDGTIIQSAGGGMTAKGRFGLRGRGKLSSDHDFLCSGRVAWVPTACMLVWRHIFEEVGGFDPELGPVAIGEDIDLCLKIRARGYGIWYEPAARVFHYEGTTFDQPELRAAKLPAFLRNMRLIRSRWLSVIQDGPWASASEIRYVHISKDYQDKCNPRVKVRHELEDSFADPGRLRPWDEELEIV